MICSGGEYLCKVNTCAVAEDMSQQAHEEEEDEDALIKDETKVIPDVDPDIAADVLNRSQQPEVKRETEMLPVYTEGQSVEYHQFLKCKF